MPHKMNLTYSSLLLSLALSVGACTGGDEGGTKAATPEPAAAPSVFTVAIEVADEIAIGALQVDFDYSASTGGFVGDSDQVECETTVDGALSSFNNIRGDKLLKAAFVAVNGMAGPLRLAECKWEGEFDPSKMVVEVRDASTPDLADIAPVPELKIVIED